MSVETSGSNMRSIIVLVRSDYRVSSLAQRCTDFGEYVVVVLNDSLRLPGAFIIPFCIPPFRTCGLAYRYS